MKNAVFGKLWKIWENKKILNLLQQKKRRNSLVSEPNYHSAKFFTEYLLAMEMKKGQILINKPAFFGLSTPEFSQILMYQFWCDYVRSKYSKKSKLFHCIHNNRSYL